MVTGPFSAPGFVLTEKLALLAPPGMVTLVGTVAIDVLPLDSVTTAPPTGAVLFRFTVAVEEPPATTELGLRVREASATGPDPPATACSTPTELLASVPGDFRSRTQSTTNRL